MFQFDSKDTNKENTSDNSALNPTALTQDEVGAIIRLAEDHSLSRTAQVKLLLLARKRKKQADIRSKKIK